MIDSNRLIQFKVLAECQNMTKAAEKLYISQPALSKMLAGLEKELGCPLFNRVGKRLYLNENGRKLLKYAARVEEILAQIEDDFLVGKKEERVLSIYSIGNFFPFILKDYFKNGVRPIKLKLIEDSEIPSQLLSGDADAVIADDFYLKEYFKYGLAHLPILSEQLLLSVPMNHRLAQYRTLKITDLQDEDVLHTTASDEINNWLDRILEMNDVKVHWSWALDADTWRYYMQHGSGDLQPFFLTSGAFLTNEFQNERRTRRLLKITGQYTNRMIYIWYFEKNKEILEEFLESARKMYC